MARKTSVPGTNAYLQNFLSVGPDVDLASALANSPVELSPGLWKRADFLTIIVSNTTAAEPLTWQLVFVDHRNDIAAAAAGYVYAAIGGVSSDVPGGRTKDPDGAGQASLHNPMQFDLRGISRHEGTRCFLVLLTDPTTSAFLESLEGVESKPI